MKRAILIILAVAILGALSFYVNNHKNDTRSALLGSTNSSSSTVHTGSSTSSTTKYKDGTYTGDAAETPYGIVQISTVISGGKITDVKFLQMPFEERRSQEITNQAEPQLKLNTLDAQSPSIDFVSGATSTSYGYQESLQAALDQAKLS